MSLCSYFGYHISIIMLDCNSIMIENNNERWWYLENSNLLFVMCQKLNTGGSSVIPRGTKCKLHLEMG